MKDLNVRPETNQRRKDRQQRLWHWPLIFLSRYATEVREQKQKCYWDFIKMKSFCKVKETTKAKRQHTKWKEILVNNTSNKELVCKTHKGNISLKILKTNYATRDGQKNEWTCLWQDSQMASRLTERHKASPIIREMQTKTTMICHLRAVIMAKINNTRNNRCWWGFGERVASLHSWWACEQI